MWQCPQLVNSENEDLLHASDKQYYFLSQVVPRLCCDHGGSCEVGLVEAEGKTLHGERMLNDVL